jgi:hypothetical protein
MLSRLVDMDTGHRTQDTLSDSIPDISDGLHDIYDKVHEFMVQDDEEEDIGR